MLLTVREVARALRISRSSAYELANRPGFPVVRVNARRWRVPSAALADWITRTTGVAVREEDLLQSLQDSDS